MEKLLSSKLAECSVCQVQAARIILEVDGPGLPVKNIVLEGNRTQALTFPSEKTDSEIS